MPIIPGILKDALIGPGVGLFYPDDTLQSRDNERFLLYLQLYTYLFRVFNTLTIQYAGQRELARAYIIRYLRP